MAYKRELISTNQPIQLLDNSKYSETVDSNGRINVSQPLGRNDKEVTWLVQSNIPVVKNHKYYAASNYFSVNREGNFTAYIAFDNGEFSTPSIVDGISTCLATGLVSFYLKYSRSDRLGGVTVEATAGPQLFDLTATFGAGNEPSTVAEFKTKYPNELYDYRTSNCLSSYKKLLKVSDVCQLLDKSKYPATQTINGVTFTNNGDGSITVNGTVADVSGGDASFPICAVGYYIPLDNTHKYLGLTMDNIPSGAYIYVAGWKDNSPYHWVHDVGFIGSNGFFYQNKNLNVKYISMSVGIFKDATALYNFNVQPQWFDLTEMYGAGNEPATVAEFKAKFPNELYDYSPRCWVTSYKTGLIAKTKNLFNINALTPYTPETLPRGRAGIYNGNIISKGKSGDTTCSTGKTLRELCPDLVVGETYILNFETNVPSSIGGQYETIYLSGSGNWWRTLYRTITEADLSATVFIYADTDGSTYKTWNFQIEKGSTATDYVPYGYL